MMETQAVYIAEPMSDEYRSLVEDCKAIITEAVWNSRMELIVGYHQLGKRIVTDKYFKLNAHGNGKSLTDLSNFTGIHERDLYRSIQFYRKHPELSAFLDKAPEGKNISWNKIVTNYLPDNKQDKPEADEQARKLAAFVASARSLLRDYHWSRDVQAVLMAVTELE